MPRHDPPLENIDRADRLNTILRKARPDAVALVAREFISLELARRHGPRSGNLTTIGITIDFV